MTSFEIVILKRVFSISLVSRCNCNSQQLYLSGPGLVGNHPAQGEARTVVHARVDRFEVALTRRREVGALGLVHAQHCSGIFARSSPSYLRSTGAGEPSISTLIQAGLPLAMARSTAAGSSSIRVTNSPWPPRAAATRS